MRSGECNVVSLYVLYCPVNGSVCFVCCVFDGICELFGGLSKSGLCVFRELCPVSFLVVGECPSVLL